LSTIRSETSLASTDVIKGILTKGGVDGCKDISRMILIDSENWLKYGIPFQIASIRASTDVNRFKIPSISACERVAIVISWDEEGRRLVCVKVVGSEKGCVECDATDDDDWGDDGR